MSLGSGNGTSIGPVGIGGYLGRMCRSAAAAPFPGLDDATGGGGGSVPIVGDLLGGGDGGGLPVVDNLLGGDGGGGCRLSEICSAATA